ncbi:MAG: tetratricopeptide repeat protein [Aquihabitans sp.]
MATYTDVTDATAEAEILRRSDEVPVVVDLWAPWCQPCLTLGPIIEKVIAETNGEVAMVKVNIDENPQLAQMFQVQSIPAVHAVRGGQVTASFVGAQPEAKVREFVDALRPSDAEKQMAAQLEAGDEASLLQVLEAQPDHAGAIIALAEIYVHAGRADEALALLAKIPETPETRTVAAMARTGIESAAADNPALEGIEDKLDELLTRVKGDDDARQEFVDLLEVLGPNHPRTADYRKALSRQLF